MVGGSVYWESDRKKRKQYDELVEEKTKTEKRDAWIKELEARDAEDEERKMMRDRLVKGRGAEEKGLREKQAEALEKKIRGDSKPVVRSVLEPGKAGKGEEKQAEALEKKTREDSRPVVRSVLEAGEGRRDSRILDAAMSLWRSL